MRRISLLLLASLCILVAGPVPSADAQAYAVTNLVSDGSVTATTMDPNFLNPWAISVSGTWWISTANTGYNYVIPATTDAVAFKVVIPAASGSATATGSPAGSVTTGGASGMILTNGTKASFLFSSLDGAIYGWNGALGQNGAKTLVCINNSSAKASYPGLAILNVNATTSYILATNFTSGKIEVYNSSFKPATLTGSFTDPNLPANYSPWSIHILKNQVWVAYAVHTSTSPAAQVVGPGNGIVDVFDTSGNFVARAVTGGNLNAPWGVAFAPSTGFGIYSGDLLIGNFGDGRINVYDPNNYTYLGQLFDTQGKSLTYASLWELLTGQTPVLNSTGTSGGLLTNVYFTAGLTNQAHGLLGAISATSTAPTGTSPTYNFSASTGTLTVTNGNSGEASVAVDPVNGFNGTVTFSCMGLPTGATCAFSPSSVNVASNAASTALMRIDTAGMMPTTMSRRGNELIHRRTTLTLTLASLLPFSLLLFRRRRNFRDTICLIVPLFIITLGASALIIGCSSSTAPVVTPTGTSQVQVLAMGPNSAVQSYNVAFTVQ